MPFTVRDRVKRGWDKGKKGGDRQGRGRLAVTERMVVGGDG
jgi:hypothetical protein